VFRRARYWSPSWARWIQSTPSRPIHFNVIFPSASVSSVWSLTNRFSNQNIVRVSRPTCPAHLTLSVFAYTQKVLLWNSALLMPATNYPKYVIAMDFSTRLYNYGTSSFLVRLYCLLVQCVHGLNLHRSEDPKSRVFPTACLVCKCLCYSCFNWPPRHEGVLGSGGVAPRILELYH
jgi:hypothetical protein